MSDSNTILEAKPREILGKKVKSLRADGLVPGVVYGKGFKSQMVEVNSLAIQRILHRSGTAGLLELKIGSQAPVHVLISDTQNDYLGRIQHVDFHQVKMDEKVRTEVPLKLIGDVPAVYNLGGTLVQVLEELEVEALPGDLPQSIEVDVTGLEELDSHINVAQLIIPDKVIVLTDAVEMVCKIEAPRSDEEIAALDAEMGEEVVAEERKKLFNQYLYSIQIPLLSKKKIIVVAIPWQILTTSEAT